MRRKQILVKVTNVSLNLEHNEKIIFSSIDIYKK